MGRAGVDLQLLQHAGGRAGPSAACASPRGARPSRGRGRAGARASRCGRRRGSRCAGGTACRFALRGEIASFGALTTITWSPVSTCGAQIGLCLPRSSVATSVASRPRIAPSASITCHWRVMSDGSGRERAHGIFFRVRRASRRRRAIGAPGGQARTRAAADGQTRVAARRAPLTTGRAPSSDSRPVTAEPVRGATPRSRQPRPRPPGRRRAPGRRSTPPSRCCSTRRSSRSSTWSSPAATARYEALAADGTGRASGATRTARLGGRRAPRAATRSADQSTDRFTPLAAELAHRHPHRRDNTYPHALRPDRPALRLARRARPVRDPLGRRTTGRTRAGTAASTARSGVVQARAPLVFAGKGVRRLGVVPASARLVDVAPTIAALLGCAPRRRRHATSRSRTARCSTDVLDPTERPRHVVGFLFDGTNANVLYDMAARGEAPNVARLIEMGVAFGHGAMASLPTVTLANHTTILTGAHPGHHGILHNAWYDRARGEQIITNSSATWPTAMDHLTPGAESIHDAVHRTLARRVHRVGQRAVRHRRRLLDVRLLPARRGAADPEAAPTGCRTRPSDSCDRRRTTRGRRSSTTWASSRRRASSRGHYRDVELSRCRASCGATSRSPTPRCTKAGRTRRSRRRRCATATAASARCSPRSSRRGIFDDMRVRARRRPRHGGVRPACTGDWDVALRDAGLEFRDEGYGFLYFGV